MHPQKTMDMESPFIYGKIAENESFTDRVVESAQLQQNFQNLINTIIISPRRWGKTSLVNKVLKHFSDNEDFYVVHIDLFDCRNEEQFYTIFSKAVIKASNSRFDDFVASVKKYLGSFAPKISLSDSIQPYDISFSVDFNNPDLSIDDILDLPQTIALERKRKFVVCIDGFQNISSFNESIEFQRKLRAHWQRHSAVCYCLYGSKRHLLMNIFGNAEMPFFKFGDIMFLEKISKIDWITFITETFQRTGKQINEDLVGNLVDLADAHPYYVQQLAQQVWLRTSDVCTREILMDAFESLICQLALLFSNIYDNLTTKQIRFLYAVVDGVENFSSKEVLKKYDLGTSANIKNLRNATLEKDLIDIRPGGRVVMQDPMFAHWLATLRR